MTQFQSINAELNRLFNMFNDHYYNNEIGKPVITVQSNGKSRNVMGWCSCKKVWKNSEKNQFYYEIFGRRWRRRRAKTIYVKVHLSWVWNYYKSYKRCECSMC